jgi:hypothetical protein
MFFADGSGDKRKSPGKAKSAKEAKAKEAPKSKKMKVDKISEEGAVKTAVTKNNSGKKNAHNLPKVEKHEENAKVKKTEKVASPKVSPTRTGFDVNMVGITQYLTTTR